MKVYNRQEAIKKMDNLAADDKEFVFIVSYDGQQTYIVEVDQLDEREILVSFPTFSNVPTYLKNEVKPVEWQFTPPSKKVYEKAINQVKTEINAGNSYLVNLTCKVEIETNLDLKDIFFRSDALYRCWINQQFVCFSPEIFVRIERDKISSYPMKGTINAALEGAEYLLMNNEKEAAEHATIVDLIRNDLSIVASGVSVAKYRYIDRLLTNRGEILQTSSEIVGKLSPYYQKHVGELLFRLLPAGSITGAPKTETMRIIAEAEEYKRGFYTGVMGHYAKGCLDSAVMIRFVEQENQQLYYKAGGGITAKSNNEDEYLEVIHKVYVPIY